MAWSGECRLLTLMRQFIWSDILIRFSAGISDPVDSVYTLTDPSPSPLRRLMTVVLYVYIFCWVPSNSLFIPMNTRLLCYLEIFIICLNNRLFYYLFIYQKFFPWLSYHTKVMNLITRQRAELFKIEKKNQTWGFFFLTKQIL